MRTHDIQGIEIQANKDDVFAFVREPGNLTRWTNAFEQVAGGRARLLTPAGSVDITLDTLANAQAGTVDWTLRFPDGSVGLAHSRVQETTRGSCIYSFVLHAPPVELEQLEGALQEQIVTLKQELATLKELMEAQP